MRPSSVSRLSLGLGMGVCLTLCAPGAGRADTVTLKNGREVNGRLVEEREDVIRIRTGGGVIEIRKAEIATFSENENWGDYGREVPPEVAQPKPEDQPKPGEDKPASGGGAKPAPLEPGKVPTKEEWKWPAGLSPEKIAELTPIRDRYLEELKAMGPTPEERLKKLELHPEENDKLTELMQRIDFRQIQGSANLIRRKARDRIVEELGLKAAQRLIQGARQDDNYWQKRVSAEALKLLCKDDEARWVMYHFDAPGALLTLLRHQGDVTNSGPMRNQGNESLEAITKHSENWPAGMESMRSPGESAAMERWNSWWKREKSRWDEEQKKQEERRTALLEGLAKLLKGENPEVAK